MLLAMADERKQTAAYLRRIGLDEPPEVTPAGLAGLMSAHLAAVPFENLDIHMGVPIELDVDAIVAKLVERGRGGFCYELNGAFAELLGWLGFSVSLLEARVHTPDGPGIPFDHLCLEVDVGDGGGPWLVDVGFGSAFAEPLHLDVGPVEQRDPAGVFQVVDAGDGWEGWCDLVQDGAPQYRFSRQPCDLQDFAGGCLHHQTSPDSHFTQKTVCTLPVAGGRITLSATTLIVTSADGRRTTSELTPTEIGPLLADQFGIHLTAKQVATLASPEAEPADAAPSP